jgi:hypothetical protein
MPRQNQVIAVEKSVKAKTEKATAQIYQQVQKPDPLKGIARKYQPFNDAPEEQLPSESTRVQVRVHELNQQLSERFEELFDLIATKDWGNTKAKADVVVGNATLLEGAPATYLLFLEKQIDTEIRPYVAALPVLDMAEEWEYDENADAYATAPKQTVKTRKDLKVLVKAEATDKHPAQTETYTMDVPVGTWTTVHFSGAIPLREKTEMLARVDELSKAVKMAREEANNLEVEHLHIARPILDYIFGTGKK